MSIGVLRFLRIKRRAEIYKYALERIIERSNNGELGTSKVIDMRNIAENALKKGGK